MQKAGHLDWLGLSGGLFSVLRVKPEPALSEALQSHYAVLFCAVCCCFLYCCTASQSTHAHTRSRSLARAHAHSHMLIRPYLRAHSFTHTGLKLRIQPWTHTTKPWPSGFVFVGFVCLFVCSMPLRLSMELRLLCVMRHILCSRGRMAVCDALCRRR